MKKATTLMCLAVLGASLILVGFNLFSDGMFMDGLFYAAISNNLSQGIGSFWNLSFTSSMHQVFHEHPPLAMGLQSLLFDIFGETRFNERFYSLITHIITGFLLIAIWKKTSFKEDRETSWLPLLFWMSIMLVGWAVANNLLENTMMIFTTAAIYFMIQGIERKSVLNNVLAGFMICLAFLSKGFVGLFVLSFFFWYWIFTPNYGFIRMVRDTAMTIVASLLPYLILYVIYPAAIYNINDYIHQQVVTSVTGVQTVDSRFFIIKRMLQEMTPMYITAGAIIVIGKLKVTRSIFSKAEVRWFWILLAVGLSGVFPIMISMKQSAYYILASFPIMSIAIALLVAPYVQLWMNGWKNKKSVLNILRGVVVALFVTAITIAGLQKNRIGRDQEMLSDIYAIMELVPRSTDVSIAPFLHKNYSLHGYFQRYGQIGAHLLTDADRKKYLLAAKADEKYVPPTDYALVEMELSYFDLYQKVK